MRLADQELLFAACRLLRFQTERLRCRLRHLVALAVEQALRYLTLAGRQQVVLHLCLHRQRRLVVGLLQRGVDKRAEGCHTHGCLLLQPYVAVDACTLVEPALFERGIGTHTDQVVLTIFNIRCDVIHLRGIAAGLRTHIKTVEPHLCVPEDAVEAQLQLFAQILFTDLHQLPVPAHARRGVLPAYGLIAVRVTGLGGIGQGGHPVVGHLHLFPSRGIEFLRIRPLVMDRVRFCQIVKILRSTAEVLLRISRMTQFEHPSLIQPDRFPDALRIHCCDYQTAHRCQNNCLKFLHHHDSFQFLTANIRRIFLIINRLHNYFMPSS